MSASFELHAEPRNDMGKGASRRLRRQGRVPAIIYGAGRDPESLSLEHREILHELNNEAFYNHVLDIKIGVRTERAILRDLQRHPYKPSVLHVDLQRISADEKLRVSVPLHFINEETSLGVKEQGGAVSRLKNEVEVTCLPKDLPEFIEVDLINLGLGESIQLSEVKPPEGVEIIELSHDSEYDVPVVNIHGRREEMEAEEEEAEPGEEDLE